MDERIAPGFLVASPALGCPFFHHTVVLMVEHGDEGSFGFVVNKPSGVDLSSIVDQLEVGIETELSARIPVLLGGPVSTDTGWILFDPTGREPLGTDTVRLGDRIAITASASMLEELAHGADPRQLMLLLGYAGWGPGQLESEMKDGSWIPVDLDSQLVFDRDLDDRWDAALARLGIDPARVVGQSVASA